MSSIEQREETPFVTPQAALEDFAVDWGRRNIEEQITKQVAKGNHTQTPAVHSLLRRELAILAGAFEDYLVGKRTGPKHIAERLLPHLGDPTKPLKTQVGTISGVAAFLTVRSVLNDVLSPAGVTVEQAARNVSRYLTDEMRFRRFERVAPGLFNYTMDAFETDHYDHRKRKLNAQMAMAAVGDEGEYGVDTTDLELVGKWPIHFGVKCIDLLLASTSLAEKVTVRTGRKTNVLLKATRTTLAYLNERADAMRLFWPVALPMIDVPLRWSPGRRGGYKYTLRGRYPLVRKASKAHTQTIANATMPAVYEALNALQETAWQINPDVHALLSSIIERGGGLGGVPELEDEVLPSEPPRHPELHPKYRAWVILKRTTPRKKGEKSVVPEELTEYVKARRTWRMRCREIHEHNNARRIARLDWVKRLLPVLSKLAPEPRLHFVYNLDFRGRVYPVSSYLHPQGDDRSKALLRFAEGKPLGAEGVRYLAQHGASCLDKLDDMKVSRLTIKERVEWIEKHSREICMVAEDPFTHSWWTSADAKLQFYAFCCEWKRLCEWRAAGLPDRDFVSALPCSLDGSCNGLQHYSAAWRDPIGGQAVNLTPGERPQDIYLIVTEKTLSALEADAADGVKYAALWLTSGLVSRSLCKSPTMTYAYGSKLYGFKRTLLHKLAHEGETREEQDAQWERVVAHFTDAEGVSQIKPACGYLAKIILGCIKGTVMAAAQGMTWLQNFARLVVGSGNCVAWTVPGTCFPVRQEYFNLKSLRVDTVLCGTVFKPCIALPTDKPARRKQSNAVAPNVIHSLDAAALMLTVRMASERGVSSFQMIHDSYGAPAGDCAVLAHCTRQAFYDLYTEQPVVAQLAAQFGSQVAEKYAEEIEAPPPAGTLDLSKVLESAFFFA
jgi:DNA-directed RNA polymerase